MLRIAIVGCGAVAELYHIPALAALQSRGEVVISAAIDANPDRARKVADRFDNCRTYADLAMLPTEQADAAIVSSPNNLHSLQAIELLRRGLPVLVEKPLAVSLKEAQLIIDQAAASQKLLAVGLLRRFLLSCQTIKQMLSVAALGKPLLFKFYEGSRFEWPVTSPALFRRDTAGGGVLIDIGTHVLDLMCWWFGEPDTIQYADDAMGGLEASCSINVEYSEGLRGSIHLSRDFELINRYEIRCENGCISWNVGSADQVELEIHGTGVSLLSEIRQVTGFTHISPQPRSFQQSITCQLLNFLNAVEGRVELLVPGTEALRSLKIIEHCYRSGTMLPMPWMSRAEQEAGVNVQKRMASC